MSNKTVCDGLIRIKNGYMAKLPTIKLKSSKFMKLVLEVLQKEGYIKSFTQKGYDLIVDLVYRKNKGALIDLSLISKPGRRLYGNFDSKFAPKQTRHFSCILLSTSKGVLPHYQAKKLKVGGEFIAEVI